MSTKLDKEAVRQMRIDYFDLGRKQAHLARDYGVSESCVWNTVNFRDWPHVLHHGQKYTQHRLPVRVPAQPRPRCACGSFRAEGKTQCNACAVEERLAAVEARLAMLEARAAYRGAA